MNPVVSRLLDKVWYTEKDIKSKQYKSGMEHVIIGEGESFSYRKRLQTTFFITNCNKALLAENFRDARSPKVCKRCLLPIRGY